VHLLLKRSLFPDALQHLVVGNIDIHLPIIFAAPLSCPLTYSYYLLTGNPICGTIFLSSDLFLLLIHWQSPEREHARVRPRPTLCVCVCVGGGSCMKSLNGRRQKGMESLYFPVRFNVCLCLVPETSYQAAISAKDRLKWH